MQNRVCNVVRFERNRNDDSRTLHLHQCRRRSFVSCLFVSECGTALGNLIMNHKHSHSP